MRVPCTSAETNSSDYERVMRDDEQNAAAKSNVAFVKPRAKPSHTKREGEVSSLLLLCPRFSFFFSFLLNLQKHTDSQIAILHSDITDSGALSRPRSSDRAGERAATQRWVVRRAAGEGD